MKIADITLSRTSNEAFTIRDTGIGVDEVYHCWLNGADEATLLQRFPSLRLSDFASVYLFQAGLRPDGQISKRELIRSLQLVPDMVSESEIRDWVDMFIANSRSINDIMKGRITPHEEVMTDVRTHIDNLKKTDEKQ